MEYIRSICDGKSPCDRIDEEILERAIHNDGKTAVVNGAILVI